MARRKSQKVTTPFGDGTIFFSNSTGRWMGQVTVGKDINGKPKRKTVYGKDAAEVKQKLQQIKYDIYTGDFVHISHVTFAQLERQILEDKFNMNEFQEQTYHRHLETLKGLEEIAVHKLQDINPSMLKKFLLSLVDKYSQSYINKIYMMMNQCFKEAVKRKIIATNPLTDIKKPRSKRRPKKVRALTLDEQRAFLDALMKEPGKYREQMLISLFTGMRCGEINALRPEDLNFNFNFINIDKTISKGSKGEAFINDSPKTDAGNRTVPMNKLVKPILEELMEKYIPTRDGQLFHTTRGTLVTTSMVNTEFKRILKKYDIKDPRVKGSLSMHSLRHTYATRCIEGKMPPKVLQKLLGHTDIRITLDTYSDVFDQYESENVELVDQYLLDMGMAV